MTQQGGLYRFHLNDKVIQRKKTDPIQRSIGSPSFFLYFERKEKEKWQIKIFRQMRVFLIFILSFWSKNNQRLEMQIEQSLVYQWSSRIFKFKSFYPNNSSIDFSLPKEILLLPVKFEPIVHQNWYLVVKRNSKQKTQKDSFWIRKDKNNYAFRFVLDLQRQCRIIFFTLNEKFVEIKENNLENHRYLFCFWWIIFKCFEIKSRFSSCSTTRAVWTPRLVCRLNWRFRS